MLQTPIRFELKRSPSLAVWLVTVHGGGAIAALASALPAAAVAAVLALAAASLVHGLRLHALRSASRSVVWLALAPELRLGFADGRSCGARLRGRPLLHPWLVSLRLASDTGRTVVLVPPDALASRADHGSIRRSLRQGGRS